MPYSDIISLVCIWQKAINVLSYTFLAEKVIIRQMITTKDTGRELNEKAFLSVSLSNSPLKNLFTFHPLKCTVIRFPANCPSNCLLMWSYLQITLILVSLKTLSYTYECMLWTKSGTDTKSLKHYTDKLTTITTLNTEMTWSACKVSYNSNKNW